mgnify:CR=1 FL=1
MNNISPNYYHEGISSIELSDFIRTYQLDFPSGNAVKYILRHKNKNGAEDLFKAIWYLSDILENDYGIDVVADIKKQIQIIQENTKRPTNNKEE